MVLRSTALLLTGALSAQAQPAAPVFPGRTSLVVLSAAAVDGKGRAVTDLRPDEFRVLEDGRAQRVTYFARGYDTPARVLLLVDASGSMSGEMETTSARMTAVQLLDALGPRDEVALAGFDHRFFGLTPFTTDHAAVLAAFDGLEFFGSTALHDALERAAGELARFGSGRRAVVVITDGVDTVSRLTADEVIARSRALDVPLYAISVLSPLDDPLSKRYLSPPRPSAPTRGAAVLERYAALSGGRAFTVSDFAGLREAARAISHELRHQYRLGYEPPAGPPRFRRIEVLSTRRGVQVRTRTGYVPRSSAEAGGRPAVQ